MSRYLMHRALCHPALPLSRKAARAVEASELSDLEESFYEKLGADANVRLEPGINQDEFFDEQFERRAHEIQRTPSGASSVSLIPSKRGPWTGNNQLGVEREFAPDANNRQTIIKLDEWGFPQVWTLCLGLTFNPSYGAGGGLSGSFSVLAEVEFGVGGVIQYLEMDWIQGASIVLPMNALNVVASYGSVPNEAGTPSLPDDLRLRASVVHGNLTQAQPTRTYRLDGATDQVAVPPFAKSVRVLPATDPFGFYSDTPTVTFDATAFGPTVVTHLRSQFVASLDLVSSLVGAPVFLDVPEGSRFFTVNDAPAGTVVQFRLGV